jgi:hypothetical protein
MRASASAAPESQPPTNTPRQILRASTYAPAVRAPTQSSDDPIARFANGNF